MSNLDVSGSKPPPKQRLFSRQRLPAWRPIITFNLGIVLYFICGIICLILGIVFYLVLNEAPYYETRYDNLDECKIGQTCDVIIDVKKKMTGKIYLQYKLTKFYQNHRLYKSSVSESQLAGDYVDYKGMKNCKPYRSEDDDSSPEKWYLPCGVFPMSVFNDKLTWTNESMKFSEDGLTYKVERESLFKPLSSKYKAGLKWLEANNDTIFPGNQTNPHFIIWMRTQTLPTFSKIYAVCKDCTIPVGKYTVKVQNNFETSSFSGTKSIVLTKTTPAGPHQIFLGIAYIVIGGVCVLFAIFLLITVLVFPSRATE